jgi:hypothetical protein
MNTRNVPVRTRRPRAVGLGAPMLALLLVLGGSAAGCGGDAAHGSSAAMTAMPADAQAAPVVPMGDMTMPTAEQVSATWQARPAYVRDLPSEWQGAYAFALARPDVLQWLPCYCGCVGMGHRSNLDCFFQRRETGVLQFEEHASYCDICVKTANLASQMLREGKTMIQIRAAVDVQFGGTAPGTDTALPPA